MNRIIVAEYPKSGGTWLVSMIAKILDLPRRDIYITENERTNSYNAWTHPWYFGARSLSSKGECVIKSHELNASKLHDASAKVIHLIRDGRDVIVSRYFFEKEFCVKNNITADLNINFDEYVKKIAAEWSRYINSWESSNVKIVRYEELLTNTCNVLSMLLSGMGYKVDIDKIRYSVNACSIDNMRKELSQTYEYNTFVRKAISGDWKNHFTDKNTFDFNECAGDTLNKLGYK